MNKNQFEQTIRGEGLKIAIVAARFNQELTDALAEDARMTLVEQGVHADDIVLIRVPGSFELPVACAKFARTKAYDAVIALGVLIKGETRHDQYIAQSVADGLQRVAIETQTPVMFGVLTTENLEQAKARALGQGNKGHEAAMSALETIHALRASE